MPLELDEEPESNILTVTASGKLTAADYDRFLPKVEGLIKQAGKLRILFVIRDFHGFDFGAFWQDLKFSARHFRDIERLAMVGEAKWEQWMASFCKPFTTADIRYFDLHELDAAKAWIHEA